MKNKKPTLDSLLENWAVSDPLMWENDHGPKGWFAVSNEKEGIIAYFMNEEDAFRFRMSEINRILNG